MTAVAPSSEAVSHWDPLRLALQEFRQGVGAPSYAEIATRIAAARVADGMDPYAARIARSTVWEAFKTGKTRVNLPLIREIAAVLGASEEQVETWIESCHRVTPEASVVEAGFEPGPGPVGWRGALLLMAVAIVINLLGRLLTDALTLPIYLDMVGTAIAAIALGPWRGAMVGLATNYLGTLIDPDASILFALVNVVGALVWGYGVRRLRMGRTLLRFFGLNLIVAAGCSLVAVPIVLAVLGGALREGHDSVVEKLSGFGTDLMVAVGLGNMLTSTADKLLSGFVALVFVSALPLAFRRDFPLAMNVSASPESDR